MERHQARKILGLPERKWEQLDNGKWATRERTNEEWAEIIERAMAERGL